ncbi:hypothetical protein SRHO_G00139770 [Serrasalmus rhombeus]
MDIEKTETTVSQKVIVPALCGSLNVDARSLFITRPGSSNLYLESVTKAIVKTIIDALDERQDSHKLELHNSVTEKTELLASSCGSVELFNSSLSVEPSTENLTCEDQAKLQECDFRTIYQARDLMSALDLSGPSKMCITDFGECLVSELVDMTTSSQSSPRDDISSDLVVKPWKRVPPTVSAVTLQSSPQNL